LIAHGHQFSPKSLLAIAICSGDALFCSLLRNYLQVFTACGGI
jgi:hypothetical protein